MKTETENLPAEGQRSLNGKPVLTEDTFDYATARVGDYVEQAVVDNAMDCLPPACMTSHLRPDGGNPTPTGKTPRPGNGAPHLSHSSVSPAARMASGSIAGIASVARMWSEAKSLPHCRSGVTAPCWILAKSSSSNGERPAITGPTFRSPAERRPRLWWRIQPQAGCHEGAGSGHVRRLHVWLSCSRCGPRQL